MTRTKQATKAAKPAPVELRDEALDRATGGGGYGGMDADTFVFRAVSDSPSLRKK